MPLIHVPTMIEALSRINGAIVPSPSGSLRSTVKFDRRHLWVPVAENPERDADRYIRDGQDPLESVLYSSLNESELSDAIIRSSRILGQWGSPEEEGTDALAWYVSFHRDPQNWGVYIPMSGLFRFAHYISPNGPGVVGWQGVVNLALRALLAHERIHYAVDYAAGQIELLFNAPCYIQWRIALSNGRYVPDEEQLANGACLRSIRWKPKNLAVPDAYSAAINFTLTQPPGYNKGINSVDTQSFLDLANMIVADVAAQLPSPTKPSRTHPIDYTKFLPLGPLLDFRGKASRLATVDGTQCPVYLIQDESILGIPAGSMGFISQIPVIHHSKRFERDLRKVGLYEEWDEVKSILADLSIPNSRVDFKPWPPDDKPGVKGWSTRVGKGKSNIRAHIHQHIQTDEWEAERIDTADRLKHH